MARLRILKDGVELESVDLAQAGKASLVLGRADSADIRLDDRAVGREHAVFLIGSGGGSAGIVVQKKSKFGRLAVNGTETSESALKSGDVISIADYLLKVEDGTSSAGSFPNAEAPNQSVVSQDPTGAFGNPPDLAAVAENNTPPFGTLPEEAGMDANGPAIEQPSAEDPSHSGEFVGESIAAPESHFDQLDGSNFAAQSEDRTAMISTATVVSKLVFAPGTANLEEFVIKKAEISIGRGSTCDIVLKDKKASRKHMLVKRVGINFVAIDLGSGNGTSVNGVKITEQELAGDDVIRIGETEFAFKAVSQEYVEQERNQEFISPPSEEIPSDDEPGDGMMEFGAMQPASSKPLPDAVNPEALSKLAWQQTPTQGAIPGLNSNGRKKETLLDKFKKLPKTKQYLVIAALGLVIYMALEDEEPAKKPTPNPTPTVAADSADAAFNALPTEKKQFVMNTYQLALDLYKKQEYTQALYEIGKIHEILPNGYKDSFDIKKFAERSLKIIEDAETERKRKEQEEKMRKELAELVAQAEAAFNAGRFAEMKELFARVLERDPENPTILRLRQQIEERERQEQRLREAELEKQAKRRSLEEQLQEGRALLKAGRYYDVIEKMQDALILFANEKAMAAEARRLIATAKSLLKTRTQPHLAKAQAAFDQGDYRVARDEYTLALGIDYKCLQAKQGIAKIRDIIHERARKIFIEAAVAESVSDFRSAKEKYKECLEASVPEDSYYGMCTRKYKRFELVDRATASDGPVHTASPTASDPQPPQLPAPSDAGAEQAPSDALASPPPAQGQPQPQDPAPPAPSTTPQYSTPQYEGAKEQQ